MLASACLPVSPVNPKSSRAVVETYSFAQMFKLGSSGCRGRPWDSQGQGSSRPGPVSAEPVSVGAASGASYIHIYICMICMHSTVSKGRGTENTMCDPKSRDMRRGGKRWERRTDPKCKTGAT